jgi:hypothetical protein
VIQGDRISVLALLAVGVVASVCTTAIFLLPLRAVIHLVRRQRSLGSIGTPWTDAAIFARVVFYASLGNLVEIGFWALLPRISRLRNSLLPLSSEYYLRTRSLRVAPASCNAPKLQKSVLLGCGSLLLP